MKTGTSSTDGLLRAGTVTEAPGGFPVHAEELTTEWLTMVFRFSGVIRAARVVSFRCEPMSTHQGLTAQLVRVVLDFDRAEPGAPRSVVAKFSDNDSQIRTLIHSMGFYRREVHFYRHLAASTPIATPRCHFADVDPEQGTSVIILEDLAPARSCGWVTTFSPEDLAAAVTAIAEVHARWWQHEHLQDEQVLPLTGFLAVDQVTSVVDRAWSPFLSRLAVPASRQLLQVGTLLREHLGRAHGHLYGTSPRTLVHNDFDGDNMFYATGRDVPSVTVIDWQLATAGRGPIDLAWLIAGQCEPATRRDIEQPLLRRYHSLLVDRGVTGYDVEQIWDDYRLALLLPAGRIASAVGLGHAPSATGGGFWDIVYPRYVQAIVDLDVHDLVEAISL